MATKAVVQTVTQQIDRISFEHVILKRGVFTAGFLSQSGGDEPHASQILIHLRILIHFAVCCLQKVQCG